MRQLPDKIPLNLDRPKLEAYTYMCETLINLYLSDEAAELDQHDRVVIVLLQRILLKLKQTDLKLQNSFRVNLPVEQAMAMHIALKECGGVFQSTWTNPYYNGLMLQIDPILL